MAKLIYPWVVRAISEVACVGGAHTADLSPSASGRKSGWCAGRRDVCGLQESVGGVHGKGSVIWTAEEISSAADWFICCR